MPELWSLKISQKDDLISVEIEGDPPDFFTMYGILVHTAMVDLPNMFVDEPEENDAQGS